MSAVHPSASIGFSARADAYVQGRPGYPADVDQWLKTNLALCDGKTALDLGAGTGKFLPYLSATGATIVAVEHVAAMLGRLIEHHPSVTALEGTAEHIPLADATCDAVLCAQSLHWFASRAALTGRRTDAIASAVLRADLGGIAASRNHRSQHDDRSSARRDLRRGSETLRLGTL